MAERIVSRPEALPLGPIGGRGIGWNGMVMLVVAEASLFGYLLFSYYYLAVSNPPGWVLESEPSLKLALPNTFLLLASSVAAWWGERGIRKDDRGQALGGIGLAIAMGAVFAIVQGFEWKDKAYGLGTSSYTALYFVTTGFHMAHVIAGLMILGALWLWTWRGFFSPLRMLPMANGIVYWHFVDAVWLAVFSTYYLSPYLGVGQ
ncbi:cytochrome c oxidase subunit 3 [Croceibacterium aestuarii]|uniref:cytochrome c oxidase subunit 3 n=1 Tax=Croceibacterium aestuarii TaxID=3064139 RepID=UPI00272EA7F1|nr:cytochrome c oxidase subunit 3 [Croceibacterium sp. D39]